MKITNKVKVTGNIGIEKLIEVYSSIESRKYHHTLGGGGFLNHLNYLET